MARRRVYDYVTWEEEGIWTSHVPAIPGVYGLGDTPAKAEADLAEAMSTMSEYLDTVGESLPPPRSVRTGQLRA
jgi:predicted RNase H-like HicB family nuclease